MTPIDLGKHRESDMHEKVCIKENLTWNNARKIWLWSAKPNKMTKKQTFI